MNKKVIIGLVITAVLAVGAGGLWFYNSNQADTSEQQSSAQRTTVGPDVNSSEYQQYAEMSGEMFDRNFIANMIAHHQGAVDMAELALANAKHEELKTMANEIISAQETEITQMLQWQKDWGYPSTSADNMMDHSAMGMMDDMAGMNAALEGKTGDEFDKAFIEQMILHHQSAIDMAAPGKDNASHQEVKNLTVAIVDAQSREIRQMQQWQKNWGYKN